LAGIRFEKGNLRRLAAFAQTRDKIWDGVARSDKFEAFFIVELGEGLSFVFNELGAIQSVFDCRAGFTFSLPDFI
jgi:hypothetical protein